MNRSEIRRKRKLLLVSLLGGTCVGCGTTENLQFDHVLPEEMKFRIGSHMTSSLKIILPELQKCQLLCKPCHKMKTILDNGWLVPTHGSPSMYSNHKCRCDPCKNGWKIYIRKNTEKYRNDNMERSRKQRREYWKRRFENDTEGFKEYRRLISKKYREKRKAQLSGLTLT